jgi:hypothetical protein
MTKYILSIFLLFGIAIHANSPKSSSQVQTSDNKKMSAESILRIFAKDLTVSHNMYDWKEPILNSSFISWKDQTPTAAYNVFGDPIKEYSYKRDGTISFEKNIWSIRLSGARGGYTKVDFYEIQVGDVTKGLIPDKKYVLEYKDCEESISFYTSRYLVKFKDKKAFWLQKSISGGSGGSTSSYSILYDSKPLCDSEQ